jgi:hypothetical protein
VSVTCIATLPITRSHFSRHRQRRSGWLSMHGLSNRCLRSLPLCMLHQMRRLLEIRHLPNEVIACLDVDASAVDLHCKLLYWHEDYTKDLFQARMSSSCSSGFQVPTALFPTFPLYVYRPLPAACPGNSRRMQNSDVAYQANGQRHCTTGASCY